MRLSLVPPCRPSLVAAFLVAGFPLAMAAQNRAWPRLTAADVDDIARLEMFEDQRQFDSTALSQLLRASHPEVRRRAALATGRINDKRGLALLRAFPLDPDTAVAATTVFAVGHLRDSSTIPWLDSLMSAASTPRTVATEAAIALGKIQTAQSRAALAKYLVAAAANARTTPIIGEALLAIGRQPHGDLAPILRWIGANDEELRWRATWALFRPREIASVAPLLRLSKDRSALVRSWAVRGLAKAQADSAGKGSEAEAVLIAATRDGDRRVAAEAVRALGTYTDSAAVRALEAALESNDMWIAVNAAELMRTAKSPGSVGRLVAATHYSKPCALRVVAMQSLQTFAPAEALDAAVQIARDRTPYCRTTAMQALVRAVGAVGAGALDARMQRVASAVDTLKAARRAEIVSPDPLVRIAAWRSMATWADASDLQTLRAAQSFARSDSNRAVDNVATASLATIERRLDTTAARGGGAGGRGGRGGGGAGGGGGGGRGAGRGPSPQSTRTIAFYRDIVQKWIVPEYEGKPRPVARWMTPQGPIDIELYPGDAPLAVDDFVRTVESHVIEGTEFTRVVPDFVNQQQTIKAGNTLRDEVNRKGLTRGNVSWATAGLDTGAPGYTLGHTPQPHNEGNFTSIGRVIKGMDATDRIQLGDRVLSAQMMPHRSILTPIEK